MDAHLPTTPLAGSFSVVSPTNGGISHLDRGGLNGTSPTTGPVETPKGPPLTREATGVPGINIAQYANVDVIEQTIGEHVVMRRLTDGSVNATQLLKLAGLDRSRRQKVLDSEIGSQFEKVQGGTGKYQGTWVPLSSAVDLARQYGVLEVLVPLLSFDIRVSVKRPSQVDVENERRMLAQSQRDGEKSRANNHASEKPQPVFEANARMAAPPEDASMHDANGSAIHGAADTTAPDLDQQMAAAAAASVISPSSFDHPTPSDDDMVTLEPLEPADGDALAELSKEVVTDLFLNSSKGTPETLDEILAKRNATEIEADVPIDDAGHTALHWAAALGQLSLVSDLLKHGANCRRGNRKGESALVRAVLVTNSSDNQSFGELLNLLYPCLHLGDFHGRTVLHHIALTAGIPGRIDASRYYLDVLLEWAVRWRGANGVKWLVDELVDMQDSNGDTALNIAARLGSKRIAEQLVEVGASVHIRNRAGLGPTDFGLKLDAPADDQSTPSRANRPNFQQHTRAGSRALADESERRKSLAAKGHGALKEFENELKQHLDTKETVLKNMHLQLRAANEELQKLTTQKDALVSLKQRQSLSKQKIAALDTAIEQMHADFQDQQFMGTPLGTYDADEPFQITDEDMLLSIPPAILDARIRAYRENEHKLVALRNQLKNSNLDGEAKFRLVVSKCTSNDVSRVDEILDDLLATVTKGEKMEVE